MAGKPAPGTTSRLMLATKYPSSSSDAQITISRLLVAHSTKLPP
ncbi:unnamed protein product, partial [Heterosigma akashiwo]